MFTRKDYMTDKCTHSEYYGQLVTQGMKEHVARAIPQALAKSTDPVFNDISLSTWDRLGMAYGLRSEFEELGDNRSKAGMVCVLKEAARQIKEECK